jgi:uncharacterized membrane protein
MKTEEKGFERIVNFTDAVVAIAATLLILPVVDAATSVGDGSVDSFLFHIFPEFMMFTVSFVIISTRWLDHHRLFRRLDKFDSRLMIYNFLWVFGIVVMPVPTALIIVGDQVSVPAIAFYIGTLIFISIWQLAIAEHIKAHPELERDDNTEELRVLGARVYLVYLVIAFVIGVTIPVIGLWSLMILSFIPLTVRIIRKRSSNAVL